MQLTRINAAETPAVCFVFAQPIKRITGLEKADMLRTTGLNQGLVYR
jgi:hypothetical protein